MSLVVSDLKAQDASHYDLAQLSMAATPSHAVPHSFNGLRQENNIKLQGADTEFLCHCHKIFLAWLQGSIPECFTKSPSLLHLYLTGNKLTGPISDFTDTAPLQLLFAWQQQDEGGITGSVPSSIGGLANLKYVHLGANSLEGSIPVLSDTVR